MMAKLRVVGIPFSALRTFSIRFVSFLQITLSTKLLNSFDRSRCAQAVRRDVVEFHIFRSPSAYLANISISLFNGFPDVLWNVATWSFSFGHKFNFNRESIRQNIFA